MGSATHPEGAGRSDWNNPLVRVALIAVLLLVALLPGLAEAAPSCEEGPQTIGNTITGTPCDDVIRLYPGVNTAFGEGGDDVIFGRRGNARIYGGSGDDRLYGGVGDDQLRGGPGKDLLSGGFGADSLDGEVDSDLIRGDATIDAITDSGADSDGVDTLSFATGVTPGFPNQGSLFSNYAGFPAVAEGRGVYVDLAQGFANNGLAPAGGGVDLNLDGTGFERVIGTPFPDFIVGTDKDETFYGGGGADVILGEGGADVIEGGAEGDSCEAATGSTVDCETNGNTVDPRDPGAIAVGLMAPTSAGPPALYLTGSDEDDEVSVSYDEEEQEVVFALGPGSVGEFDTDPTTNGGCDTPVDDRVICTVAEAPDSIVISGLDGDDTLSAPDLPETTSVVLLGNLDDDDLSAGDTEDTLVDGAGDDLVSGGGNDDALPNNEGDDDLEAGDGNDLFISDSVCEGDAIDGGPGRDNANWAKFDSPISIDMAGGTAGLVGSGGLPDCEGEPLSSLTGIEDIEGTSFGDTLIGDDGRNGLLGRQGADSYFAGAGDDTILANSGDADAQIDCGSDSDTALVDHPEYGDPEPVNCEAIAERDPNSFRPPDTPTGPEPPPEEEVASESAQEAAPPSRRPVTRLLHRPRRMVFTKRRRRRVGFRFAAEPGARYFCRLDRGQYRPCRSPRVYAVRPGRHAFRVFAFTGSGGRDLSPARARFRVRRVSGRWIRIHRRRARNRSAQPPRSAPPRLRAR